MNGSRSSEQSNVASATLAPNSIVASALRVSPPVAGSPPDAGVKPGPEVKDVRTPSRLQVNVAGGPVLPSKSVARTRNVCGPTSVSSSSHSKPPRCMNAALSKPHGSYGCVSTRHSKVTSGSSEWKVKSAFSAHVSVRGPRSTNASGGSLGGSGTYVQSCRAGVGSASSLRSTARISSLCWPGARFITSCGYSQSSQAWSLVLSRRHSNTRSSIRVTSSSPS